MSAVVLHWQIPKNLPERVSQVLEHTTLSDSARHYAVLDVVASKLIYKHLINIPVPGPLPPEPTPGLEVLIFHIDKTCVIAAGSIASHGPGSSVDGIHLSPTQIAVTVQKVLVPAAIMTQHRKRSLESFGSPPFNVVCLRSHLHLVSTPNHVTSQSLPHINCASDPDDTPETHTLPAEESLPDPDVDDRVGTLLMDESLAEAPDIDCDMHTVDAQSSMEGQKVLDHAMANVAFPSIRSQVLKDAFHVFNMLYISCTHGLRVSFACAL